MKLTVDTKSIVDAITWVTKNYDQRDSNAYVALVVTKEGEGSLFHANPTSFMKSSFQVLDAELDSKEEGVSLALEGRYLQRLAGALAGNTGPLVAEHSSNATGEALTVKTSTGKFTIPLLDSRVASEPTIIELGEVDNREYFDSLQRLAKLCDQANAGFLPVLGAVDIKLDLENNRLVMMATDRYALGEISVPFEASAHASEYVEEREGKSVLLPVEDATLISPSKGLSTSTTLVHEPKGKKFGYVFGDGKVALFSLKDAEQLAYITAKENAAKSVKNSISLDVNEFKRALATVSNLSWDEEDIYLDITKDELVVGDSHRNNKVSVAIEDASVDEDYSVKFVRSIINEAFSPVSTARMNLKWKDAKLPFILESLLEDGTVAENVFVFMVPTA